MLLSCLCGAVRVLLPGRPDYAHACNCTLCRKTGAWWSYHPPAEVRVSGPTSGYGRADKADPASADVRFCATCGVTTHFRLTEAAVARHGDTLTGVNVRLADEGELAGMELRFPDGRAWSGAGAFGYVRPPHIL